MAPSLRVKFRGLAVLSAAGALLAALGCTGSSSVSLGDNGVAGASGTSGSLGSLGAATNAATNGGSGAHTSSGTGAGSNGGTGTGAGTSGGGATNGTSGTVCTNLQCDVFTNCADGGHTLVTGRIMDPAGRDPLYNVVAYIPNSAVQPLPSGVPPPAQGAMCATCDSLFSGEPVAVGFSDDDGNFVIQDAPATTEEVPVVVQVGKWRTHITLGGIAQCADTDAGSISLPSQMDPNDGIINIPDIAVSTGSADSLECLLVRVGLSPSEYVAGDSPAGKVHIFNGGNPGGSGGGGGGGVGKQEKNLMSGAPDSDSSLWDSPADLAKYDLVLLSCEGGETYDANPANLETYLDTGGRVFASHFHYAWFKGAANGSYAAPSDWGSNLATWTTGTGVESGSTAEGQIVTTLWNGTTFPKGQALDAWLGNTQALGTGGTPGDLYIVAPKENSAVTASNTPSQPWITDPSTSSTLYFSFDTPVGGYTPAGTELGVQYCGRAVFSGLHVGGASYDGVNCSGGGGGGGSGNGCNSGSVAANPPPSGCDTSHPLSAQEKALEFMLFDLSSCVVPDTANPADAGVGPINFK